MNGAYRITPENAITVTELNWYLKELLDSDPIVSRIFVRGEISNFKNQYSSGHLYFSLKDNDALVRTVMFRSSAVKLGFIPENGMKVIIGGRVSVYGKDGQYQLYADSMIPDGVGELYLAYEQLKKRLEAEGLFDEAHKKPLPKLPGAIGIITSPTGAAIRDILNILKRRYPLANVVLYPAQVQGDGAYVGLIEGIRYFNRTAGVDVIIIGRGGGSIEDLWEFNREELAREIYASEIPIISAVGHETDFTVCDFVADKRAPTPSAAAELAVPDHRELRQGLKNLQERLRGDVKTKIDRLRTKTERLSSCYAMRSFGDLVSSKRMDILRLNEKLDGAVSAHIKSDRSRLVWLTGKLDALSPLAVISRGYAIVSKSDGEADITDVSELFVGERVNIRLRDGSATAEIVSTEVFDK